MNGLLKMFLFPAVLRFWGTARPVAVGLLLSVIGVAADRILLTRFGNAPSLFMGFPFMYRAIRAGGRTPIWRAIPAVIVLGMAEYALHERFLSSAYRRAPVQGGDPDR
ncbi:hypothetical protein CVV65_09165 [Kyrpidia spormannii]|uniref:Uncharacterized protein n=2 Tax=Kyrpidia spormannii TaxID=2055160 RepID=A0A2K8N701_9BACL|nr:hypothetical protein [Kyrpidia spormannii]ATY85073.1 hypothetical protein CVV65_09165 [Kyrpidia spormannii]CAB3392640.1 conserved protein of unknown function [Kyrpidia spormannii]